MAKLHQYGTRQAMTGFGRTMLNQEAKDKVKELQPALHVAHDHLFMKDQTHTRTYQTVMNAIEKTEKWLQEK